jgi:hypothetical protein
MTPTIALTKFLPLVLPHVKECPHTIATFNLRLAAIEFCERTKCWRHMTTLNVTRDGQNLAAPYYAAIHQIEKAVFDDETTLEPIQFSDVDEANFAEQLGQDPRHITQQAYNSIRVLPFKEGKLTLSLFLKPVNGMDMTLGADGVVADEYDAVPDFLYTMHAEHIACGAIARLAMQPNKPWTNPDLAMMHGQRFERAMNDHFSVSLTGQQRAKRRTRYVDF